MRTLLKYKIRAEVNLWVEIFLDLLRHWQVDYQLNEVETFNKTVINPGRWARVFPPDEYWGTYTLHEILHVCLHELRNGDKQTRREKEEVFVQIVCELIGAERAQEVLKARRKWNREVRQVVAGHGKEKKVPKSNGGMTDKKNRQDSNNNQ